VKDVRPDDAEVHRDKGLSERLAVLWAALSVLLLAPVAYGLALAHQWLFFPAPAVEELLRNGPFRGYWRAPMLLEIQGYAVELAVLALLLAALFRLRSTPWPRAVREAVFHLLPLGLSPFLLFVDDFYTRILLQSALIAGVAGSRPPGPTTSGSPAGPGASPRSWPSSPRPTTSRSPGCNTPATGPRSTTSASLPARCALPSTATGSSSRRNSA
jgi:hypothetical protein